MRSETVPESASHQYLDNNSNNPAALVVGSVEAFLGCKMANGINLMTCAALWWPNNNVAWRARNITATNDKLGASINEKDMTLYFQSVLALLGAVLYCWYSYNTIFYTIGIYLYLTTKIELKDCNV